MRKIGWVVAFTFIAMGSAGFATATIQVAKVDFEKLRPLLRDMVFAKPKNAELREAYEAQQDKERGMLTSMMDQAKGGSFDPFKAASEDFSAGFMEKMEIDRKVEALSRAEFLTAVEEVYGDKYGLVIDDSAGDQILFTTLTIPDITPNLRNHLLKEAASDKGKIDQDD